MDYHNPTDEIIGHSILVPNIFANIAVMFLSIRRVKSTLMQKFALNLCIPSLAYSVYSITVFALKLGSRKEEIDLTELVEMRENTELDRTADYILYVCAYDYQMLVISLVAITYATFAKPLFIQRHLEGWFIHVLFLACHLTAIAMTVSTMLSTDQTEAMVYEIPHALVIEWNDVVEAVFCLSTFAVLIGLYVVCIKSIFKFGRRNSITTRNSQNRNSMRTQLLAILAYITPPNIFVIPTSFCIDIFAVWLPKGAPVLTQICLVKVIFHDTLMGSRLLVSSIGILIVFPDYRKALLRAVWSRKYGTQFVRTISKAQMTSL
ncbi:hypothetical protein L596_012019 [Steinernema carpocapsae]|uniref:G-protein coupled receptors family 1 profile domain-containing protein n=1 Tax=Steinernema carpocapsae TaxID=34508 RepID=A0A4U5NW55_STECR|nr:hypothetical protein L596_012019 [Steinernema carpocapsae]